MTWCEYYAGQISDVFDDLLYNWNTWVKPRKDWLVSHYTTSGWNLTWRTNVALCISQLALNQELLIYGNRGKSLPMLIPYMFVNCLGGEEPEEYELTVEKICEAWAKDDFKGRALTIGFIDRQRQLIWDEHFDFQWAARPEI